jgi:outer membrane protein OmpA-like peptidoglycan-associated protein
VVVTNGSDKTFTILPDANYHILDVLVDGGTVGAVASYTFYDVIAPHSIAASFTIDQYAISVGAVTGGAVVCPTPVDHGASVDCTITPASGYVLDALTDNGSDVIAEVSGGAYTLSSVTEAHTIAAGFKLGLGMSCSGAGDCHSGFCADDVCCDTACDGASDDCNACSVAAGAAADGVCGPSTGNSCSDGSLCTFGDTCDNGTCVGDAVVCTALDECHVAGSCQESDGTCTNPDETDGVTCDGGIGECTGGVCKPANGQACADDSGCASGHCADGFCCDTACAGQCEACDLQGQAGSCLPVAGAPHNDRVACASDGSVCDGACDGVNRTACAYPDAETECRAASCGEGIATMAAACNGTGACPAPETVECGLYACGETDCNGDCQVDLDCAAGSWCSAGVCAPQKDPASSCAADNECLSGHCADGVCCDTACSGQCEACDELDTAGTCVPVTGAPRNSRTPCAADGSACDGYCDGSSADSCAYPDLSVTCREAGCEDGVATLGATCDGTGVCPAVQVQSCGAYQCGETQCLGDCAVDGDCAAPYWCSAGICEPEKEAGAGCSGANECASGYCADGVCCNDACNGQCEACNGVDTAGECLPVAGEPRGARPACASDGSLCGGECDGELRTACAYPAEQILCRAASCSEGVATLEAGCNGSGACPALITQSCGMYGCAETACHGDCQTDAECASGNWCSAGICTPTKEQGSSCAAANECATGLCVDGVCCDSACTGQCEACSEAGHEGFCVAVAGAPRGGRTPCATDRSACGGSCDGTNSLACAYPDGSTLCSPAVCEDGVATPAWFCDGSGGCAQVEQQSCAPYACAENACGAGCSADADCDGSHVCFEGSCVTEAEVRAEKDRRLGGYGVAGSGLSCAAGEASPWSVLLLVLFALAFAARRRRASAALSVALVIAVGGVARAADVSTNILLQRFQPASGFSDILAVQGAPEPGDFRLGFAASLNYGRAPLRLIGNEDQHDRAIVSQQTGLDLGATLGLFDRWELSVVVPVTVYQKNGRASIVDPRFDASGTSTSISDIRLSPKVRLIRISDFTFAAAAPLALPTGDGASYGSGGTSINPKIISEWNGRVRVVANLGVVLRSSQDVVDLAVGPALSFGAGMELPVAVKGQEVAGLLTVVGETGFRDVSLGSTPLEMLAAVRWQGPSGLAVTLGGGPGLTTGYGTPKYRLLASLDFVPFSIEEPVPAASAELAAVPASIAPKASQAAAEPAPESVPIDSEPETSSPAGPDTEDPEPVAKPAATPYPDEEDAKVVMEESRIVTLEKVFFDTGRDTVADQSRAVLAQVAKTLIANPQIRLLRVEGHTDNQGPAAYNVDLSSRRARAVRDILVQEGVAPERLEAEGLGPSRPIESNETEQGRAANRRVEFIVVEQGRVARARAEAATTDEL